MCGLCGGRGASAFTARLIASWNGINLPGAFNHLRNVLRDQLVSCTISRTDRFSRTDLCLTLPLRASVVTHRPLHETSNARWNTWVDFVRRQRANRAADSGPLYSCYTLAARLIRSKCARPVGKAKRFPRCTFTRMTQSTSSEQTDPSATQSPDRTASRGLTSA